MSIYNLPTALFDVLSKPENTELKTVMEDLLGKVDALQTDVDYVRDLECRIEQLETDIDRMLNERDIEESHERFHR